MATLRWDDIDWDNRTIYVQRSNKDGGKIESTKNKKTRRDVFCTDSIQNENLKVESA